MQQSANLHGFGLFHECEWWGTHSVCEIHSDPPPGVLAVKHLQLSSGICCRWTKWVSKSPQVWISPLDGSKMYVQGHMQFGWPQGGDLNLHEFIFQRWHSVSESHSVVQCYKELEASEKNILRFDWLCCPWSSFKSQTSRISSILSFSTCQWQQWFSHNSCTCEGNLSTPQNCNPISTYLHRDTELRSKSSIFWRLLQSLFAAYTCSYFRWEVLAESLISSHPWQGWPQHRIYVKIWEGYMPEGSPPFRNFHPARDRVGGHWK